jgi:PAS domain S-box-containing protein
MSIKKRIIVIVYLVMATALISYFLFQRFVVSPMFSKLEMQQARQNMDRCIQALNREIHHLDLFNSDWAAWDDTWQFVQDPDEKFIESNLVPSTFLDNGLNLICIFDRTGRRIWGETWDLEKKTPITMPDFTSVKWNWSHPFLRLEDEDDFRTGITLTSHGLMMISSRPVIRSDMSGPVRGAIMMGRFINDAFEKQLVRQTRVSMKFRVLESSDLPDKVAAGPDTGQPLSYRFERPGRELMRIHTLYPGLYGHPVLEIQADFPRQITIIGDRMLYIEMAGALIIGHTALFILLYLMGRSAMKPLDLLTRHVSLLGWDGTLKPVNMGQRQDEFGLLATRFNQMIERLSENALRREEAESELRETNLRLNHLISSSEAVIYTCEAAGNFGATRISENIERILGYPAARFTEDSGFWLNNIHPGDRDRILENLAVIFETGQHSHEYRFRHADGAWHYLYDRIRLIHDETGAPCEMVGSIIDITDRRRTEEALRESEERFTNLLASLNDVVWSGAIDYSEIYYVNPAYERVYGQSIENFMQNPDLWFKAVHPDWRKEVKKQSLRMREEGAYNMEYPIIRPDGEIRWIQDRAALIHDAEGRPARVGGVASDITDMKAMRDQMAETRHLAELGEMGASFAHEIRNPLAGISGVLQVIRNSLEPGETHREPIEEALRQITRVELTVRQLLEYSRSWHPEKRPLELRAFVAAACETFTENLDADQYTLQLEEGGPTPLLADPQQLRQVLENVFYNAVYAMPEGGSIRIQIQDSNGRTRVRICDDGPGFPPDTEARVFKPFFTTRARGTGLGLSICRRIMEAHGGAIHALNRREGGAEIILEFYREESA